MFGFFKKSAKPISSDEKETPVDEKALRDSIASLEIRLGETNEKAELVELWNQLGALYFQLKDYDKSIDYYESSIHEDGKLGKAHTDLMKLYNIKRRAAAEQKDGVAARAYMDKIDRLTNLSKNSMRQGNF